jgi:hypothetical protein
MGGYCSPTVSISQFLHWLTDQTVAFTEAPAGLALFALPWFSHPFTFG